MQLTDKRIINKLRKLSDSVVAESIERIPDSDINGRSDAEILADEVSYMLMQYHVVNYTRYEILRDSKEILSNPEMYPDEYQVEEAIQCVEDHKEYKKCLRELQKMGAYGHWCKVDGRDVIVLR